MLPDAQGCEDEAIEMCVYEAVRALGGLLKTQGQLAAGETMMEQLELMDQKSGAEQMEG